MFLNLTASPTQNATSTSAAPPQETIFPLNTPSIFSATTPAKLREVLKKPHVNINATDDYSCTALMYAVSRLMEAKETAEQKEARACLDILMRHPKTSLTIVNAKSKTAFDIVLDKLEAETKKPSADTATSPTIDALLELVLDRHSAAEILASVGKRLKKKELALKLVQALINKANYTYTRENCTKEKNEFASRMDFIDLELNYALGEKGKEQPTILRSIFDDCDVDIKKEAAKLLNEAFSQWSKGLGYSDGKFVEVFQFRKLDTVLEASEAKTEARGPRTAGATWTRARRRADEIPDYSQDYKQDEVSPYFKAIVKRDVDQVLRLVRDKINPNVFDQAGRSALEFALTLPHDNIEGVEIILALLSHPDINVWLHDEHFEVQGKKYSYPPLMRFLNYLKGLSQNKSIILSPDDAAILVKLLAKMEISDATQFNEFFAMAATGDAESLGEIKHANLLYDVKTSIWKVVTRSTPYVEKEAVRLAILRATDEMEHKAAISDRGNSPLVQVTKPYGANALACWAEEREEQKTPGNCLLQRELQTNLEKRKVLVTKAPKEPPLALVAALQVAKALKPRTNNLNRFAATARFGTNEEFKKLLRSVYGTDVVSHTGAAGSEHKKTAAEAEREGTELKHYDICERTTDGASVVTLVLTRQEYEREHPKIMKQAADLAPATLAADIKLSPDAEFYNFLYDSLAFSTGAAGLRNYFDARALLRKVVSRKTAFEKATRGGLSKGNAFEYWMKKADAMPAAQAVLFLARFCTWNSAASPYLYNWDTKRWGHKELRVGDDTLRNAEKLEKLFLKKMEEAGMPKIAHMPVQLMAAMICEGLDIRDGHNLAAKAAEQKAASKESKLEESLPPYVQRLHDLVTSFNTNAKPGTWPDPNKFFDDLYHALTDAPGAENLYAFWLYTQSKSLQRIFNTKREDTPDGNTRPYSKRTFRKYLLKHASELANSKPGPEGARLAAEFLAPLMSRNNGGSALFYLWHTKGWGHLEGRFSEASKAIKKIAPAYERYLIAAGLRGKATLKASYKAATEQSKTTGEGETKTVAGEVKVANSAEGQPKKLALSAQADSSKTITTNEPQPKKAASKKAAVSEVGKLRVAALAAKFQDKSGTGGANSLPAASPHTGAGAGKADSETIVSRTRSAAIIQTP